MAQKILIVEDMQSLADALRVFLQREGFQVVLAYDGVEGLRLVTEEKPDLVILDIVLPGEDGLEVCRRIRQEPETARLPILILSGKGEEMDKVVGLEVGADDYLAKPFGDRELVVRVRALLRRSLAPAQSRVLRVGGIEVDSERYTVSVGGRPVALTPRELELLRALLEAKGRALGRGYLLETLWGRDRKVGIESRTLDVHVRSLRNKLGREGQRILTVRKVGYRVDTSLAVPEQGPLPGA